MSDLIKPEPWSIIDEDGVQRHYILSKFDAITGREIITKYFMGFLPKLGDYPLTEAMMFKLMSFVCVEGNEGKPLRLSTPGLIRNHVPSAEILTAIESKMMQYNFSFFRDGRILDFCDGLSQIFLQKLSETLTRSSEPSSPLEKQATANSENPTA